MKHVSELAIIGLLLKPFKTWVVPGKLTVILTRTRGGMLEIELVRFMDHLPCQGIYVTTGILIHFVWIHLILVSVKPTLEW